MLQQHTKHTTKYTQREAERRTFQSYLSTKQAATILNISPRTLERWRIEGKGPDYRKFGTRVTYSQSALLEWAEKQTRSNTSEVA